MKELIAVFIGSGLGGLSRFGLSKWVDSWHQQPFPYGTLVVNISACFILGLVIGLSDHKQVLSPAARLFLAVGFCGGFSTFSTFSSETLGLLQQGQQGSAALYVLSSILVCVSATFSGLWLAGKL